MSQRSGVLEAEVSPSGALRIEFDRDQVDLDALRIELQQQGLEIHADALSVADVAGIQVAKPDVGEHPQAHGEPGHVHGADEASGGEKNESAHGEPGHVHHANEGRGGKAHGHAHGGLFGEHTELIFSLITGALLLVGWLVGRSEASPGWLPTALFVTAYVFGFRGGRRAGASDLGKHMTRGILHRTCHA